MVVPYPKFIRKCRISGWKMTIRAMTPTSMKVLTSLLIIFMSRASTMTIRMYISRMPMKTLMAAEFRIHLNTRKMMVATSSMSKMSVNERFTRLSHSNSIASLRLQWRSCAKITNMSGITIQAFPVIFA